MGSTKLYNIYCKGTHIEWWISHMASEIYNSGSELQFHSFRLKLNVLYYIILQSLVT